MKAYRRAMLAHWDRTLDMQRAQQRAAPLNVQSSPQPAPAVHAKPNRHQRRRNQLFNRKLSEKLAKDGTPASVEILPDGGLHVKVSKEELEMHYADEESADTQVGD